MALLYWPVAWCVLFCKINVEKKMNIELPEILVVKGDIELSDWITDSECQDITKVIDANGGKPTVKLTLMSKSMGDIVFTNLYGKFISKKK